MSFQWNVGCWLANLLAVSDSIRFCIFLLCLTRLFHNSVSCGRLIIIKMILILRNAIIFCLAGIELISTL